MKQVTHSLRLIPEYDPGSICSPEEMLLFDIETTGLSKEKTQVYLIGCAWYQEGQWRMRQWLTENTGDEAFVLEDFLEFAAGFSVLVTFNGNRFDIPYLQHKAAYYGISSEGLDKQRLDIYLRAKTARKLLGLSSMSQKSVEEFLGIHREDQMNGGLLIPVYYEYEKKGSRELEDLLLLHNYDDIQGMLKILPILSYPDLLEGKYTFDSAGEESGTLELRFRLDHPVPVPCDLLTAEDYCKAGNRLGEGGRGIRIRVEKDLLRLWIPILEGTGRVPLEPVSDYYYLPEEDQVIHKDVAQFLGRSRKVKATRKNCYLKKEGRFLPQICVRKEPVFTFSDNPKKTYADLDSVLADPAPRDLFSAMASDILSLVRISTAY